MIILQELKQTVETKEKELKEIKTRLATMETTRSFFELPKEARLKPRHMMKITLGVFKIATVGHFITRTQLGELFGMSMPPGRWDQSQTTTAFNSVKNKLIDAGIISERKLKIEGWKREYYFTLLREVTEEDMAQLS